MRIEPLRPAMLEEAVQLWRRSGLTRPWNDPHEDARRAMNGPASTILAGIDGEELVATAMVGHDGHRGWVYYLAVAPDARRHGHGRAMMQACERWLLEHDVPKLNLMIRGDNIRGREFYLTLGYEPDDVIVLSRRLRR